MRFERGTPAERRYMRALADLGDGPQRSGDVAERLRVKVTRIGPTRSKRITKGIVTARSTARRRSPCRSSTSAGAA